VLFFRNFKGAEVNEQIFMLLTYLEFHQEFADT